MHTLNKLILIALAITTLFASCKREDKEEDQNKFDRSEMLKNYADNLIIPAYNDLKTGVAELKSAANTFVSESNTANLSNLQDKWLNAYKLWQYTNAYNFGPAGAQGLTRDLSEEIATFPASEAKIENAIGNPNFTDFNRDARGFLAIEYLIFNLDGNNQSIIDAFDQNRKNYLTGAINDIEGRVNTVVTAWSGAYRNEFINNNGTDVGSSSSQLYNEFIKSYESIKNIKIELPLGKRPGQTQVEPQLVEAYYSGKSLEVLQVHLQAIEDIYYGKSKSGAKASGFIDYVKSVEGGENLVNSTVDQWANVKEAFEAIPKNTPLSVQIENSPELADKLREQLQRHTRFFKSDMSSILGIAITFSSGDGD